MHKIAAAILALTFSAFSILAAEIPSVSYLEHWLRSPEKAGTYAGPAPEFRYGPLLSEAIADRDRPLVEALLPLYRQAVVFDRDLLSLELNLNRESAVAANEIADQLESLIALLTDRPVAGPASEIEREALSGVAGRFRVEEAKTTATIPALERRLALLGGQARENTAQSETPPVVSGDAATLAASSPLVPLFGLLAERRVTPLAALPMQSESLSANWSEAEAVPEPAFVRWGGRDPFSPKTKAEIMDADRMVLTEFIQRRLDRIAAWRLAETAVSAARLDKMQAAAALAFRQYRQGAIPISLLIESQDSWFEALQARHEVILQLWRETYDLQSMTKWSVPESKQHQ